MTTLEMQPTTSQEQRRSQRIVLRIGVTILGTATDGHPICEQAYTLVVNAHGAYLPLQAPVALGQVLTVHHNKTEEELFCRVARIDRKSDGSAHLAIEFLQPSPRFWRINFPPADWKPAEPEVSKTHGLRCVPSAVSQAA